MSTFIYCARIDALKDESLFKRLYQQMPSSRKEKIDSLVFQSDKMLSLGAGVLLAYGTARAGLSSLPEISVTDTGKPFFRDHLEIGFSISHSGDTVVCAIAEHDVGIDVEKIGKADLSIAGRFFTDDENLLIGNQPDELSKKDVFFRLWTLKESFLKITGLGFSLPLNRFSIALRDDGISITQSHDERSYFFREFDDLPGYKLACCSVEDDFRGICDISLENAFPD